ncbi:MAG: hypothetical protein HFI39_12250 [Lachnospiraceae bacterium]|nr:hypothetical protein [Lachnospiraceae bacterium]
MEQITSAEELLKRLHDSRIVIYGTGYVGKKFFQALKNNGLVQNVVSFAVSKVPADLTVIEGIQVHSIEHIAFGDSVMVCVAVHEALKDKMIGTLEQMGMRKYVWIHPFLYELFLGRPLKRDVDVEVENIVQTCRDDYRLAVRWLVIEQYFGKNNLGYSLYERAESIHCEKYTARERLKKFLELIRSWEKTGYLEDRRIQINSRYEIVDGRHRIAAAYYFNQRTVRCDIYPGEVPVEKLHDEEVMLTEKVLTDHGFSVKEIGLLAEMNQMKHHKGVP